MKLQKKLAGMYLGKNHFIFDRFKNNSFEKDNNFGSQLLIIYWRLEIWEY